MYLLVNKSYHTYRYHTYRLAMSPDFGRSLRLFWLNFNLRVFTKYLRLFKFWSSGFCATRLAANVNRCICDVVRSLSLLWSAQSLYWVGLFCAFNRVFSVRSCIEWVFSAHPIRRAEAACRWGKFEPLRKIVWDSLRLSRAFYVVLVWQRL